MGLAISSTSVWIAVVTVVVADTFTTRPSFRIQRPRSFVLCERLSSWSRRPIVSLRRPGRKRPSKTKTRRTLNMTTISNRTSSLRMTSANAMMTSATKSTTTTRSRRCSTVAQWRMVMNSQLRRASTIGTKCRTKSKIAYGSRSTTFATVAFGLRLGPSISSISIAFRSIRSGVATRLGCRTICSPASSFVSTTATDSFDASNISYSNLSTLLRIAPSSSNSNPGSSAKKMVLIGGTSHRSSNKSLRRTRGSITVAAFPKFTSTVTKTSTTFW
mmetsp:Transcript_29430/g.90021  ORF Transcript_29430/g.90021 Transcript_29430/m.90021 type:complete len:273 (-) Transcript_29430:963-1781(-)